MADVAFQCPLLRLGGTVETRGSFEPRTSRCPLILEDFRIEVRLFIGQGHGETGEYKVKSIAELLIFSHFLMYLEIFFSKRKHEILKSHR